MKKVLILLALPAFLSSYMLINDASQYHGIKQESFGTGEVLRFKMKYGIFTVGEGSMHISDKIHRMNYRDCYKVDVYGKTSGMVRWVSTVDDHWGAYIDSAALVPHMAYRNIKEGNYRKNEVTRFDHATDRIAVKTKDKKTGKFKDPVYYDAPDNVRDMLGGLLLVRAYDFDTIRVDDSFQVKGFFEDTFYDLTVVYKGIEEVKTKAGKINSHVLLPYMPENKLFDGENSIRAYISADENKIPVKVEADMFIGSASVELTNYYGLKNRLNIR